jgi:hypothetical protein
LAASLAERKPMDDSKITAPSLNVPNNTTREADEDILTYTV